VSKIVSKIKLAIPKVIKHWEDNLKLAKSGTLKMEDIKYSKCSFCDIFFDISQKKCFPREGVSCPLKESKKNLCCREWRAAYKALLEEDKKTTLVQAVGGMLERVRKLQKRKEIKMFKDQVAVVVQMDSKYNLSAKKEESIDNDIERFSTVNVIHNDNDIKKIMSEHIDIWRLYASTSYCYFCDNDTIANNFIERITDCLVVVD
jgi:uncharacterized protein YaaR (DUF327 family)